MILSFQKIKELNLVRNIQAEELRYQPAGVDFTIKKIHTWTNAGTIDFSNEDRIISDLKEIKLNGKTFFGRGAYLVEFNETGSLPKNIAAFVQTRSSLLRMGAGVIAGFIDPGYDGLVLAVLNVFNENGIFILPNARICQWRFDLLGEETTKPYNGQYQGQTKIESSD